MFCHLHPVIGVNVLPSIGVIRDHEVGETIKIACVPAGDQRAQYCVGNWFERVSINDVDADGYSRKAMRVRSD